MTEQEWTDLGRRAVACRGWQWMPGMLAYSPGGIWEWRHVSVAKWADSLGIRRNTPADAIPDLRDPATLGCLLALVREAWSAHAGTDPEPCTHQTMDGTWGVGSWVSRTFAAINLPTYPTEAAALVAALESAQ